MLFLIVFSSVCALSKRTVFGAIYWQVPLPESQMKVCGNGISPLLDTLS